jgi:hypothetical protein
MKRDLGLIREILLKTEADEALVVSGRSAREVTRHVVLLQEAGLMEADIRLIANGFKTIWDSRLTWAGYEYLDGLRSKPTASDKSDEKSLAANAAVVHVEERRSASSPFIRRR